MKNFYKVSNTIENGPRMDRVKSRISPMNHRIWSVIAPMLLVLCTLFGVNESAWGGNGKAALRLVSSPTSGGYVHASTSSGSFSGSSTDETATSGKTSSDVILYRYYKVKNDNYVFKGWSSSDANNSGSSSASVSVSPGSWTLIGTNTNTDTYYAIFARLTASSTAEMAFGTKLIGVGWNEGTTKSVTIDYVHAGEITATITGTNATEFSLSNSSSDQEKTVVSNNTNSETNSTITVYFNPSSEGSKSAKLTISSSNDLTSIEINLSGTGQATVNPTFTNTIAASYYVEDGPLNLASLWTSDNENGTITYSKVSFKADVENESGASVPSISGNMLSLGQAGTLVIQMHQAASTGYYEKTVKDTIRINKRPNTLYANGSDDYSVDMFVDRTQDVTLTATNTDYTNCPITATLATSGENASLVYTQNTRTGVVSSNYHLGDETWNIHQEENYKYKEGNGSFTVTVKKADEATDCYVLTKQTDEQHNSLGRTTHEHEWDSENAAGTVYFEVSHSWGSIDAYVIVQENVGGEWKDVKDAKFDDFGTSYVSKSKELSQSAKGVRFFCSGSGSGDYVRNVYVTRKTYLNASSFTIDTTSTGNTIHPGEAPGVGSFTISYSLANGGDLNIINDNEKFTLDASSITNVDCKTGIKTINVTYQSDEAGTDYAHVVIYNDVYRKEITITGVTAKFPQPINWEVGNVIRLGSTIENVASVITNNTISYSSNHPEIIKVVDGKLVAVGVGTATITADADGNDGYEAAHDTKTIEVTNDLIQTIVWTQDADLLRLKTGGSPLTLTAYATSDVEGCTTDKARPITYTSGDESVVRVNALTNQLVIVGKGRTTLTATQDGTNADADGHKYMTVSETKTVVVRNPDDPCDNYLYEQSGEKKEDFGISLTNPQEKNVISLKNINEPSTLTMKYKGEKKKVGLIEYYNGTMKVEEYYDNDWHEVENGNLGTPPENNYTTFTTTLKRKTTQVRVRVYSGRGYHYVTEMKIGQARYIEGTSLNTFETKVGTPASQDLTISYNNLVGPVSMTFGHNPSNFSLSEAYIDGDCGSKGTKTITVYYTPTAATSEETEVLRISDGVTELNINLTGVATLTNRQIVWNIDDETNKYTVETVDLTAEARTVVGNSVAGEVYYTKGGLSTTGTLSGSTLTFDKAGVTYIAAQCVADAKYNTPAAVTKTFNVALTPTEVVEAPTIGSVVSGTALGDITVSGGTARNTINQGSVSGTFTVQNGNVTDVGPHRPVTVLFTPTDGTMYATCTYNMDIEVIQREATDEEIGTVTASAITYGQTAAANSTLSNNGTLAGTWEWIDERADDVLAVTTYNDMQARFTPENGNIQPKVVTVSLTVNKADPIAAANAVEITYGATASSVDLEGTGVAGTWNWTDTRKDDVLAAGSYTMDVHFVPTEATNYNEKDATVALTVKKATTTLSWTSNPTDLAYNATDAVYTATSASDGAITYSIISGGSYAHIDANTGALTIDLPGNTITIQAEQAEGTNYSAPTTITVEVTIAAAPVGPNTFTNIQGDNDWQNPDNWSNGVPSGTDPDVIISGELIIDESVTVGGMTILPSGSVTVVESGTLTVNGESADHSAYGDLHVKEQGNVVLDNSANLKVRDFILDAKLGNSSNQAASGQVKKTSGELNVLGDAYFQMTFDPSNAITYGWYDFVVPFDVNTADGIFRVEANGDITPMASGVDFLVQSFSETRCAAGQKAWTNFSGTMLAGQGYTITFNYQPGFDQNTFLFKKKAGAAIGGSNQYAATRTNNGSAVDEGWNVLGNGTLQHIELTQNLKIQVFEHASNSYRPFVSTEQSIAVGTSFQVQVTAPQNIVMSSATNKPILAPKYEGREIDEFRLSLTSDGEEREADRLWISASEEADGQYQIGHDLLKKGTMTSSKVARMWCERDGLKLCDIEMQMLNNEANSPLMFFAPQAGTYTLSIEEAPADANLYLTYNGAVIWDLTSSPYLLDLSKGTTIGYGLQIVAADAPQVTTGVDDVQGGEAQVRKVIIDNKMYIITPEGAIFDAIGKKVQ